MPIVRLAVYRTIGNQLSARIAEYSTPYEMARVAFHALVSLGIEALNQETTSIRDRSIPQTYLPCCLLFVLFQLYAYSSSYSILVG